jgi:hypothetical protein
MKVVIELTRRRRRPNSGFCSPPVEAEEFFVVAAGLFQAGGFAIGNHENLFVMFCACAVSPWPAPGRYGWCRGPPVVGAT